MLLKPKKDPHLVTSYRPISLLSLLSKILEKIILTRLQAIITEKILHCHINLIFKKNMPQLNKFTDLQIKSLKLLNANSYCVAIFLDVEKAFDKVWHEGLLYKIKLKFPIANYHLIKLYLEKRRFIVKTQDSISDIYTVKAIVPYGSILELTLYILYTK